MKRIVAAFATLVLVAVSGCEAPRDPAGPGEVAPQLGRDAADRVVRINVIADRPVDDAMLAELGRLGTVTGRLDEIDAVLMRGQESALPSIRALSFVSYAGPPAERTARPVDLVEAADFGDGLGTWDLDAVEVTDPGFDNRTVEYDGTGVYVGVLDTGLLDTWRRYFPEERIATAHARSFVGGGALDRGTVAEQPNKWEHDTSSHGTHVTSTILGYDLRGVPVNGVAPLATVIPVKVLNNNGSGWSSTIARGILHVAGLKAGPLADHPVVINMSLGGSTLDPVEQAALDYAIGQGVVVVAAAGNFGDRGMAYPAAYEPVISVAASGWTGQWMPGADGDPFNWWWADDVPDPTSADDFYIVDFSSREKPGQDLDVAAPGTWVVGPFQLQMGRTSYFFVSGTSMASPHVAGVVALLAQKDPGLTAAEAESILESTAVPLPPGTRTITLPDGSTEEVEWGADATGAGLVVADAALAAGGS